MIGMTGMKTAIITFLALAAAMAALAGETVRVANGPRPSQTIRNWHLKQEWRAGPEGENFLFGRIGDVALDGYGNLYLLDFQQQETYVFDPAGKFLKTLGGRGEGPGETTLARDLLLRAGRTGLLNRFPAEIVWFDELYGTPHDFEEDDILEEDAVDDVFLMYPEEIEC